MDVGEWRDVWARSGGRPRVGGWGGVSGWVPGGYRGGARGPVQPTEEMLRRTSFVLITGYSYSQVSLGFIIISQARRRSDQIIKKISMRTW